MMETATNLWTVEPRGAQMLVTSSAEAELKGADQSVAALSDGRLVALSR